MRPTLIFFSLLPAFAVSQSNKYCFPPDFGNNGKCFEHVEQTHADWEVARSLCKLQFGDIGGDLASISSAFENNAVAQILATAPNSENHPWIGAKRIGSNYFQWSDASPFTYTNWQTGEPSGNCGQICRNNDNTDFCQHSKWRAASCSTVATFVCEYYPNGGGPGTPTTPNPSKCTHMDILFLIDETSGGPFENGFEHAKEFIQSVVRVVNSPVADNRFAWIAFNDRIWWQTPFLNAADFISNVTASYFEVGFTNFTVGFAGANETISNFTNSSRKTVLILTTDTRPDSDSEANVTAIATYLRCQLNTAIIAMGIDEDDIGTTFVQTVVGYNASDSCGRGYYQAIPSYDNLTTIGTSAVVNILSCRHLMDKRKFNEAEN